MTRDEKVTSAQAVKRIDFAQYRSESRSIKLYERFPRIDKGLEHFVVYQPNEDGSRILEINKY